MIGIYKFQENIALQIVDAINNDTQTPTIKTGQGKFYIMCRVAELMPEKQFLLFCNPEGLFQYQRMLEKSNVKNLKLIKIT